MGNLLGGIEEDDVMENDIAQLDERLALIEERDDISKENFGMVIESS